MKTLFVLLVIALCSTLLHAQPKYRTFDQSELSQPKETRVGKVGNRWLYFIFHNTTTDTIYGIHIRFSQQPLSSALFHNSHESQSWILYDTVNVITLNDPVLPNDTIGV